MTESHRHKDGIIGIFARHPVAANLVMIIMLLSGALALSSLNTQFFPTFDIQIVTVRVVWPGATAEDVEKSITIPLEQELRSVEGLDKITSTSAQNVGVIVLEFPEGTDMGDATDRVDARVKAVRNLPQDARTPQVSHVINFEPIARLLIHGPSDREELRKLAYRFEEQLLARGVAKVDIRGLPDEEIAVQFSQRQLQALNLSLAEVGRRINEVSRDLPGGQIGKRDVARELRTLEQRRNAAGFEELPLVANLKGDYVRLGDVAKVERRPRTNQITITYQGKPAVELRAQRATTGDTLKSATILREWLEEARKDLPKGVEITVYDESWLLIRDRINLLLKNGLSGLVLVVAILFLFLNVRVAWWVTLGIPVSFMATLALVWLAGGSINMISLFALIMALGIIVDDAIVVGEDALAHYQKGERSLEAAEGGARRMLAPVLSSSLTTIAAFIPLMMVSGIIGTIMFDIPFVIICVIIASLVESFLVLPGHLRHSFHKAHHKRPSPLRQKLDRAFEDFRDRRFSPLVRAAVSRPGVTIASALAALIMAIGLLAGGRIGFTFFPTVEGNVIHASASFVSGTPPERVDAFIDKVEQAMYQAEEALGGNLIRIAKVSHGMGIFSNAQSGRAGEQFATVTAELVPSDERDVRNQDFLDEWRKHFTDAPGLEKMTLTSRRGGGPPGRDLEIKLTGPDTDRLKEAALAITTVLEGMDGVSGIEDDMPYGHQQLIYELTPMGRAQGLTEAEVARQLSNALTGNLSQIFIDGRDELEVRVMLRDQRRYHLSGLDSMNLRLPDGGRIPLTTALRLKERQGFEILRHYDGELSATVFADVDTSRNNANDIRAQLKKELFAKVLHKWGVHMSYTGKAQDQKETMADMKKGALFALAMIYIVLAWVFGSYGWPLVVMSIIPFGIVGAIVGHWVMGIELTILSLFGIFGLSGIVVNDSIILVVFYKELREQGMAVDKAIVEAAGQRLRAVLLTSLTTIAGLTPLLFETSLQAQFLIPMAVSISFGLAFATFLVLLLVPSLLMLHEGFVLRRRARVENRNAVVTSSNG
ncbi:efflux RND transporter permease subunit [Thiolapillus brandeum]|uniref:Acriflavin resistance protein n=1 Tax=Thiolapillus brandeum TaxID=1076588 RepID=A0A7U6JJS2_9GAMM|nr:efflux RND transporter permease subunit [Thiolapillus brandeum]BAO45115.1 acriflavin resistance protein [Thiolapillus brandeum]